MLLNFFDSQGLFYVDRNWKSLFSSLILTILFKNNSKYVFLCYLKVIGIKIVERIDYISVKVLAKS